MWSWDKKSDFKTLEGQIIKKINASDDLVEFITEDDKVYQMFHDQDCCEYVYVEDICGELDDLLDVPIISAEESSNSDDPQKEGYEDTSHTWTFYRISTRKGTVVIRWYGSSNGFYSESVGFYEGKVK